MKALNCNRLLKCFGSAGRLFHMRITRLESKYLTRRRGYDAEILIYT